VYNPWSVINDLCKPTPQPGLHWVNTSTNHLVHELVSRADITVKRGLREPLDEAMGHTSQQPVREYVPPRERVYSGLINRWLRGGKSGDGNGVELIETLVAGGVEELAAEFPEFVADSVSYFDTGGKQPERFYHGFILGMVQYLRDRYIVDSQRESGLGRYDLALEPKDKLTNPCFVMEFKSCVRQTDSLEDTAQQALRQIQEKHYHLNLVKRGVKSVIALGLAFKGKEACVKHEHVSSC
ncbi:MAG: PD-(D/E)XK nuclease domain-containing protein, partial [Myxococcota bacterium]